MGLINTHAIKMDDNSLKCAPSQLFIILDFFEETLKDYMEKNGFESL